MPRQASGLSPAQSRAVSLLAQGTSMAAVARATGMSYSTLRSWARKPFFQEALADLIQPLLATASDETNGDGAPMSIQEFIERLEKLARHSNDERTQLAALSKLGEVLGILGINRVNPDAALDRVAAAAAAEMVRRGVVEL